MKCNIRIVRAKVKYQPDIYLVKIGKTILYSAKNRRDANKKLKHARENYC